MVDSVSVSSFGYHAYKSGLDGLSDADKCRNESTCCSVMYLFGEEIDSGGKGVWPRHR